MEMDRITTTKTPVEILEKKIADDPAYQPTIPLMRLIKEENLRVFDDFDGDLIISNTKWGSSKIPVQGEMTINHLPLIKEETESGCESEVDGEDPSIVISDGHCFKHFFKVEEEIDENQAVAERLPSLPLESPDKSKTRVLKKHECSSCHETFYCSSVVTEPEPNNSGDTPFICQTCDKTTSPTEEMRIAPPVHSEVDTIVLKMFHSGEQTHECTICSKKFTRSDSLRIHLLIHSGKKPQPCVICGESFAESRLLKFHISENHVRAMEKEHECNICNGKFTSRENLRIHETFQHSLKCYKCHRQFRSMIGLKRHLRAHTGKTCSLCGKNFARAKDFKVHLLTHSKPKPYECTVCKQKFTELGYLENHKRIHAHANSY